MKSYFSLVKFSHTIFAMPFALAGFFIATRQQGPDALNWRLLLLVVLCMVFARSAAMGFNRWLDRDIDAVNPRTRMREIPSGTIPARSALVFVLVNCLLFILTTFFINTLCFLLSPVALAVVLGYSYTKRFTWLCHFVLGLGLALAPVGAYLAVTGHFAWLPVLLGFTVLFWTAGFDIIYALQDEEFDKSQQ
ncbi:MAG TPA: UbiA-like polyprenyltransferase, partial [Saprospiraceae bacterium]|nr:UbiA-like polyprenyltransferase [Saprospiraceae bacterium]